MTARSFLPLCLVAACGVSASAATVKVAVFGANNTTAYLNTQFGAGSAVQVTDAQLATSGFLQSNGFTTFYYTRDGSSFGTSLSAAAAANVQGFVGSTGDVVLLNGDFADGVGADTYINTLTTNAVSFAAASGHGYVGELTGAAAGLTSNVNGTALGLISGSAGILQGGGASGSDTSITLTAAGQASAVTAGLSSPYNPASVEFGTVFTGVASPLILGVYDNGNAAIVALDQNGAVPSVVPLPPAVAAGLASFGAIWLRRRRAGAPTAI